MFRIKLSVLFLLGVGTIRSIHSVSIHSGSVHSGDIYPRGSAEDLVAMTIMIKNEVGAIERTLDPLYRAGIRKFLVYDTGSTDGTQDRVRAFFAEHPCEHHLVEEPFVDFSISRNRALDLAEQFFPDVMFDLMPDAEWFLNEPALGGLLDWCVRNRTDTEPVYLIKIANDGAAFYTARLMRRSARCRFEGVVHEQLKTPAQVRLPDEIWFEYAPSAQGMRNTQERWRRDARLLRTYLAEHPHDARTLFYLGQTYGALEEYETAYDFYAQRTKVEGFIEESFLARYRMAIIAEAFAQENRPGWTWERAFNHYLDAFSYRPIRIEPLVKIAAHYWYSKDYYLAYLFARRACEMTYPADYFCVEKSMYEFDRYDLFGVAAGAIGKLSEAYWAFKRALESKPDADCVQQNLATCIKLMKGETCR